MGAFGFGPLVSSPKEPPAQMFSTANGSLQGVMDGVNTLFTMGVTLKRGRVWRNGVLQTHGTDVAVVGQAVVFLPGAEPQPGDIITVFGNPGS
jgi:hypothetical protein